MNYLSHKTILEILGQIEKLPNSIYGNYQSSKSNSEWIYFKNDEDEDYDFRIKQKHSRASRNPEEGDVLSVKMNFNNFEFEQHIKTNGNTEFQFTIKKNNDILSGYEQYFSNEGIGESDKINYQRNNNNDIYRVDLKIEENSESKELIEWILKVIIARVKYAVDNNLQNGTRAQIDSLDVKAQFAQWLIENGGNSYTSYYGSSINSILQKLDEINEYFNQNLFIVFNGDKMKNYISDQLYKNGDNQNLEFIQYSKKNQNGIPSAIIGRQNYFKFLDTLATSILNNYETHKQCYTNMTQSLNTILYGPPGTGKTYNTVNKALEIIYGDKLSSKIEEKLKNEKDENVEESKKERNAIRNLFNDLKNEGQIVFTTFHQNYTYEDFMIGLKPDIAKEEGLAFKEYKGVFYKIAKKARADFENKEGDNFEEIYQKLIQEYQEKEDDYILLTPTHKKKFIITLNTNNNFSARAIEGTAQMTVQKEWLREYLMNGMIVDWKPYVVSIANKLIDLGYKKSGTKSTTNNNYVLIIDEINRANISKVFGELITLLEDDKRLGKENELEVTLPNGETFGVPPNLYVIGTMNTADKSIALIDIALRRRFHFVGMYPNPELIELHSDTEEIKESIEGIKKKKSFLTAINNAIFEKKKSADWLVGHAYFMKDESIESVIENKIIPLLMEYFGNKTEEVEKVLGETNYPYKFNVNGTYTWDNFNV